VSLESRYRYSNEIVYNNFLWPENISEKQVSAIEKAIEKVLSVRKSITNCPIGKMYENGKMPPALVKAHIELDKAVDSSYKKATFTSDTNRMEFLFELYEKYTAELFSKEIPKKINHDLYFSNY